MRRPPSILKRCPEGINCNGSNGGGTCDRHEVGFRRRSDSETLSDEQVLESNDEGIGTDHIDEKIEDGEIRSAKDLELFLGKDVVENGRNILSAEDGNSNGSNMSQLQLPSIVIMNEAGFDKSPVSSRSESPLR